MTDTTSTSTPTDAPSVIAPPTFDLIPLTPDVRKAIDEMGFTTPTPVQVAAFGPAAEGKDLVVQARTGTGKTAAFGLPLVDRRVRSDGGAQCLILAPTRELALQSAREIERLGKYKGIKAVAVYGGAPIEKQVRELEEGAQIVSGTPGRVLDHLRRGTIDGKSLRILVLDEADEMLSMGFAEELNAIVELLPKARQTMLFSATIEENVQRLAARLQKDPVQLSLSSDQVGAQTISHFVYLVSGLGKSRDLTRIIEVENPESAIIFCNTKAVTEQVAAELQSAGFSADWLNGDLPQSQREAVLLKTREGKLRFLVCTDVAARGIDISHLTHVINYDFPNELEAYVHRTGRTGRAGRTGTAITLVAGADLGSLYYLRLQYKIFPVERSLPNAGDLKTRQELDRVEMLASAFASEPSATDRALARRLLTHDDRERLVAGLLRAFFGVGVDEKQAEEQAAAARRAKAPRAVEPVRAREDRDDGRRRRPREEAERRPREEAERRPREEAERRPVVVPVAAEETTREERAPSDAPSREPRRRRERTERTEASATLPGLAPASPEGVEARPERAPRERRDEGERAPRGERPEERFTDDGMTMIFVNLGRREQIRVVDLLRLFEDRAGLGKDALGRIRIRDRHSFVGVPKDRADAAVAAILGAKFGDKDIVAEVARAETRDGVETPDGAPS